MADFEYEGVSYFFEQPNLLKDLRTRIIKIAASYVGQTGAKAGSGTQSKPKNFKDPLFEEKLKNIGLLKQPWCNMFCRLVYAEAFFGGNALYPTPPSNPSGNSWDSNNFSKHSSIANKYQISLKNQNPSINYNQPTRGANDFAVGHTVDNFMKRLTKNRFIDLAGNKSASALAIYKDSTKKGILINEFKKNKIILPGDLIIFDNTKNGYLNKSAGREKGADHIGIYIGGTSNTQVIDGNYSNSVKNRNANIDGDLTIRGFVQLTTVETP